MGTPAALTGAKLMVPLASSTPAEFLIPAAKTWTQPEGTCAVTVSENMSAARAAIIRNSAVRFMVTP
jgi:hypothetical protein